MKGMFSGKAAWHSYSFIPWQLFYGKKQHRWRNFFSSSGNATLSILLNYQEIDAQIQTFANQN